MLLTRNCEASRHFCLRQFTWNFGIYFYVLMQINGILSTSAVDTFKTSNLHQKHKTCTNSSATTWLNQEWFRKKSLPQRPLADKSLLQTSCCFFVAFFRCHILSKDLVDTSTYILYFEFRFHRIQLFSSLLLLFWVFSYF